MTEMQRYEKEEKDEKRQEKEEKDRGEKWQRDPLSAVIWAAILIWAGLALLGGNLGLLAGYPGLEAWPLIFIGAGLIVIAEAVIRLLVPAYRRPVTGTFILGAVLLAIGLGNLVQRDVVLPLVLIVIGAAILLRGLGGRRAA